MKKITDLKKASELWSICGDFGELDGEVKIQNNTVSCESDALYVCSEFEKEENVTSITGKVKNISGKAVTLRSLSYNFCFDGGEYDIYSQYNGWQNESLGDWQPLITGVSITGNSIRNAQHAAPFMCLWNRQSERGTVFHMMSEALWEMKATRYLKSGEATYINVQMGVYEHDFSLELLPGEEIELPRIIYYNASNKTDIDCYKLHDYMNKKYPRKEMPVMYNTWLCRFDKITYENVANQIPLAAEIGAEYFVIDAGWFGHGTDWTSSRGDWVENETGALKGRMKDIADEVRSHGMKFGFWIEAESADRNSDIVKNHPEYFLSGDVEFLDFSREDACEYMFETICGLIEKYDAKFMKFDFNADLYYDKNRSSFMKYYIGYTKLIKKIRAKYPDFYMENCSSGGARMELKNGLLFDSFWLSDDQSPYETMRIFKDTVRRMPPQWIECWATICGYEGIVYPGIPDEKILATHDATWGNVIKVEQDYLNAMLTGSPVGLSFDLSTLSETMFCNIKNFITEFKDNRAYWMNANCRILTDTETMLVMQFSNRDLSDVRLVIASDKVRQDNITVFPVLSDGMYNVNGEIISSDDINENGIDVHIKGNYHGEFIHICRL